MHRAHRRQQPVLPGGRGPGFRRQSLRGGLWYQPRAGIQQTRSNRYANTHAIADSDLQADFNTQAHTIQNSHPQTDPDSHPLTSPDAYAFFRSSPALLAQRKPVEDSQKSRSNSASLGIDGTEAA